jgi:hypothetical protein
LRRRARAPLAGVALALSVAGCSYPRLIDEGAVDEAYLQRVIDTTSRVRGVPLAQPLRWTLLTDEEQRARLRAEVASVDSELEVELTVWRAFGLLPDGYGTDEVADLLGDQVAAHYDTKTKTFYLVSRPADWTMMSWLLEKDLESEFVACHEITHALQDLRYDLEAFQGTDLSSDEALARGAVVEGDATYYGLIGMLDGAVPDPTLAVQTLELDAEMVASLAAEADEDASPIIMESLLFKYFAGFTLLQRLGAGQLEEVWRDPPRSTEQVLHPEKYVAREAPVAIALGEVALPAGWALLKEDTLGELGLGILLRELVGPPFGDDEVTHDDVRRAAEGWGGDRFRVYRAAGGELALAWALRFDAPADALEFVELYRLRARGREDRPASLCALVGERAVAVVEAPTGEVLRAIAPAALSSTP